MKVLILGSGGREHALAWRLLRDSEVTSVFVWPGNAGMAQTPNLQVINQEVEFESVHRWVQGEKIDLVVIGPEKWIFDGWIDRFQERGVSAYGPSKAASFLEGSKIQSKQFMRDHRIPTSDFEVAETLEQALRVIDSKPTWSGYVLKLSGPALGKGVIVTRSASDAREAAKNFFHHRPPGIEEGMVIEDCVSGCEVSLFYVCADQEYRFLASACDHKRLKDGDQGPNTGGMGAYSPATWFSSELLKKVEEQMVRPTLKGMSESGKPFYGTLFLGLMVEGEKLSLLEYNTRFGDPETQTFLPRLQGSFYEVLSAVARRDSKKLKQSSLTTSSTCSLHVVKAAKGYPGLFGEPIESGRAIRFQKNESLWFFAGVKANAEGFETSGGRVCGITALGSTLVEARKHAYAAIQEVSFSGEQYRTDIGREIEASS